MMGRVASAPTGAGLSIAGSETAGCGKFGATMTERPALTNLVLLDKRGQRDTFIFSIRNGTLFHAIHGRHIFDIVRTYTPTVRPIGRGAGSLWVTPADSILLSSSAILCFIPSNRLSVLSNENVPADTSSFFPSSENLRVGSMRGTGVEKSRKSEMRQCALPLSGSDCLEREGAASSIRCEEGKGAWGKPRISTISWSSSSPRCFNSRTSATLFRCSRGHTVCDTRQGQRSHHL